MPLIFDRLLPKIGAIMKPDTLKEWTMFFEFNCPSSSGLTGFCICS